MSKGLEALEHIRKVNYYEDEEEIVEDCYGIEKDLSIIEKELKALEIIIKKNVKIEWLKHSNNIEKYNQGIGDLLEYLTQEEYDLLKEVLNYGDKN